MSKARTRVYYRNKFLHIGHLQTLFHNNNVAKATNGRCFAIIDDRQDPARIQDVQEDFDYLELDHVQLVSVHKNSARILEYTLSLIEQGLIYMHYCSTTEHNPERITNLVKNPQMHFRLMLRCGGYGEDPVIGYTKQLPDAPLTLVFIFDYIIKVLDKLLHITDVISTGTNTTDITDVREPNISLFFDKDAPIRYHRLDTYFIQGFKYSKKDWPSLNERDPHLLTIKGLKARHVPRTVLYAFYIHAVQMGMIKITFLGNLLRSYLNRACDRVFGVLSPVKVQLESWPQNHTEYICRPTNPLRDNSGLSLCPLSNTLYIENADCGIDLDKVTQGRYCRLKYSQYIRCINVQCDDKGPVSIRAEFIDDETPMGAPKKSIHWISAPYGQEPTAVIFQLYHWFYTGQGQSKPPQLIKGYIDNIVFRDLSKIYQLERTGYFMYDREASDKHGVPTFSRICKIQ